MQCYFDIDHLSIGNEDRTNKMSKTLSQMMLTEIRQERTFHMILITTPRKDLQIILEPIKKNNP